MKHVTQSDCSAEDTDIKQTVLNTEIFFNDDDLLKK